MCMNGHHGLSLAKVLLASSRALCPICASTDKSSAVRQHLPLSESQQPFQQPSLTLATRTAQHQLGFFREDSATYLNTIRGPKSKVEDQKGPPSQDESFALSTMQTLKREIAYATDRRCQVLPEHRKFTVALDLGEL